MMLTVLPTCGFFGGEKIFSQNPCDLLKETVPWQMCAYCSKNPSRPPLPDPAAAAALARQVQPCVGCGDGPAA